MTLKVLLVDDELLARVRLKNLLEECKPPVDVAGEAGDSAQALALMREQRFDVAFLDIHMPGLSGIALGHALRTFPHPPAIVFVTAHPEHAATAFDMDAVDYLTKPVRLERLQKALNKAQTHFTPSNEAGLKSDSPDVLIIQERNRVVRLPVSEIVYVRSELKYLTVRTVARSYLTDGTLSDLEERWGRRFVRTHRSVIVARHLMQALERTEGEQGEGWVLHVQGVDEPIPVSRRQLMPVKQALGEA